jgi:hypothetical protein
LQVETVEVVGHPLRAPTDALMITDEPCLSNELHRALQAKYPLRRLRDPASFMPAYYEALVGAALAAWLDLRSRMQSQIPDYPFGRAMEIAGALEGYDKHRDVFWMIQTQSLVKIMPRGTCVRPIRLIYTTGFSKRILKPRQGNSLSSSARTRVCDNIKAFLLPKRASV